MKILQLLKVIAPFIYFCFLGIVCLLFLQNVSGLNTILQALAVLTVIIIVASRLVLPKIGPKFKQAAKIVLLFPGILFIDLLVFSSGSLTSPFLILTHFFAIGLAFLISPKIAISFITATIVSIIIGLSLNPLDLKTAIASPLISILSFISYIAIIPFSYILAREYKIKEEWIGVLEKQIATSKTQEEELLKNIESAVILINPDYKIIYLNKAFQKLTGFGHEIISQDFFKAFSLKDNNGRDIASYSLPLAQTLTTKENSTVEDLKIKTKSQNYVPVDVKILPAIGPEGPLGIIILFEDRSSREKMAKTKENAAQSALAFFLSYLNDQKQILFKLEKNSAIKDQVEKLQSQNQSLENLAQDFIYALKLEQGQIGALSSIFDIGEIVEEEVAEEKSLANQFGIKLNMQTGPKRAALVQPKQSLKMTPDKKTFPETYILGNIAWTKDSLKRILELLIKISQKGELIDVSVTRKEGSAEVSFTCQKLNVKPQHTGDLFEKFYGRLEDEQALYGTSGLSGYIAKNLIERMGGKISIESQDQGAIITISFGTQNQDTTVSAS